MSSEPIGNFNGGAKSARDKLNRIVEVCNEIKHVRGDEKFSVVRKNAAGTTIALNIDQASARIPRPPSEMGTLYLLQGAGTDEDTGCARYYAGVNSYGVVDLDKDSNANLPDAEMIFPLVPNAIFVNLFEQGTQASGTHVLCTDDSDNNNGAVVIGYNVGNTIGPPENSGDDGDSGGPLPVYYGSIAPLGTLFRVKLAPVEGGEDDAHLGSSGFHYDAYTIAFDFPLLLGRDLTPEFRPYRNGITERALKGMGYIDPTGVFHLAMAFEQPEGLLFKVNLNQVDGTDGDDTHPASWTYDVSSMTGVMLRSDKPVLRPRPNGSMSKASFGYAYYDQFGDLELAEAWEVPGTIECPNSGDSGG